MTSKTNDFDVRLFSPETKERDLLFHVHAARGLCVCVCDFVCVSLNLAVIAKLLQLTLFEISDRQHRGSHADSGTSITPHTCLNSCLPMLTCMQSKLGALTIFKPCLGPHTFPS